MKRPPFKMVPSRYAVARHAAPDGRVRPLTGRASFVWQWGVLIPIAAGTAPRGVEIRETGLRQGPWHLIDYTEAEAYELIRKHYRPGTVRLVESHRRKRGLPVIERSR